MPYFSNDDLPDPIKKHLPQGAQTIYRKAFNKAYHAHYGHDDDAAFKIAWAAVKEKYKKNEKGKWVRKKNKKS